MTNDELQALVLSLEKTATGIKRHITEEAQKLANPMRIAYAKAAKGQVDAKNAELRCYTVAFQALEQFLKDLAGASGGADVPVATLMDALAAARAAGDAEHKRQQKEKAGA